MEKMTALEEHFRHTREKFNKIAQQGLTRLELAQKTFLQVEKAFIDFQLLLQKPEVRQIIHKLETHSLEMNDKPHENSQPRQSEDTPHSEAISQ